MIAAAALVLSACSTTLQVYSSPEHETLDGSIAWQGMDEVTFAIDTGRERPITFRAIAEHTAKDLIQRLP